MHRPSSFVDEGFVIARQAFDLFHGEPPSRPCLLRREHRKWTRRAPRPKKDGGLAFILRGRPFVDGNMSR